MSKSDFTVSAVVQRSPGSNITLKVVSSNITFDRGWEPYGQGKLTVMKPALLADLQYIDPRNQPRIVVTLTRTDSGVVHSTRTINACVIARRLKHGKRVRTMDLEIETDETLLQQYGLLSATPERVYGLNVRDAVTYALNKIGRSAYLVTEPTITNLHANPSVETNTTGYSLVNGSTITRGNTYGIGSTWGLRVACPASGVADSGVALGVPTPVTIGQVFTYSVYIRAVTAGTYRLSAQGTAWSSSSTTLTLAAGATGRMSITKTATGNGTAILYVFRPTALAGSVVNFDIDRVMVTAGSTLYEYFDGTTTDTTNHTYAWTGATDNSTSTDIPVQDASLSNTADLTVLTNMSTNPIGEAATVTTGWTVIPGTTGVAAATIQSRLGPVRNILRVRWSTASTAAGGGVYHDVTVTAGKKYSFKMNFVDTQTGFYTRLQLQVEWRTGGGTISTVLGPEIDMTPYFGLGYTDQFVIEGREAPQTATIARVKIVSVAGVGYNNWLINADLHVGSLMVNEGTSVHRYFDGTGAYNDADIWPSNFVQAWTGAAHTSTSTRTPQSANEAMIWTPDKSAWDWVAAIVKSAGLQLWCDEARNWHLLSLTYGPPSTDPASTATFTVASGTNLRDGSDEISMRKDSHYATGIVAFTGEDGVTLHFANGGSADDVSYGYTPSTGTATKVLSFPLGVVAPLGLATLLARAVTLGRVYDLDVTPDYSITPAQTLSVTVPDESAAALQLGAVTWRQAKKSADMSIATQ